MSAGLLPAEVSTAAERNAEALLADEKDNIQILNLVDEIRGLLLDIIT